MKDGILVIYKEKGYTSHDVVARLRGILHMKRIGHTGTLDPDATGVLPIVLGKATRLSELLTDKSKTYKTVMRLGLVTDTQDMTGTVLKENPVLVSEDQIISTAKSFTGIQQQIPPMYSAIKVNGKKLYELAREGKEITRKPRPVCFYNIEVEKIDIPLVYMTVTCSQGTYIRTLCHDLGAKLGCGGSMQELIRTKSGAFSIDDSLKLSEVEERMKAGILENSILGLEEILSEYPRLLVCDAGDKLLLNGNPLDSELTNKKILDGKVRMCTSEGRFIGLYEWKREKYYPFKMFL